jgi:hypothetical protein
MLHLLKRHPIPIRARFDFTLVLTYALPRGVLEPLLTPGLALDAFGDWGFVAVAMVQTRELRPSFMPAWCGRDFFLTGYRIFARYQNRAGRSLRGLKILRSDTDKRTMAWLGNALTGYGYRRAEVKIEAQPPRLAVQITTPRAEADLRVVADLSLLSPGDESLPAGSPFRDTADARRFAGPLPHTFSYERETNSVVIVRGLREDWQPRLVKADVAEATFFKQPCFRGARSLLASAFYVADVPYRWERGVVEKLGGGGR